jgi:rhodanese-related sulfurtransferase
VAEEEHEKQEEQEKLEEKLDANEARKVIATPGPAQVIDLRPPEEFGEGHIAGASNASEDDLEQALEDLSKDDPVIVVCADGKQSAEVAERLRDDGWDAASVEGGMSSWTSDKLPTQPAEDQEFEGPRRPGPLGQ